MKFDCTKLVRAQITNLSYIYIIRTIINNKKSGQLTLITYFVRFFANFSMLLRKWRLQHATSQVATRDRTVCGSISAQ